MGKLSNKLGILKFSSSLTQL